MVMSLGDLPHLVSFHYTKYSKFIKIQMHFASCRFVVLAVSAFCRFSHSRLFSTHDIFRF